MISGEQNAKLPIGSALSGLRGKRWLADFLSYPLEQGIMCMKLAEARREEGAVVSCTVQSWRRHTSEPEQVKTGRFQSMAAAPARAPR